MKSTSIQNSIHKFDTVSERIEGELEAALLDAYSIAPAKAVEGNYSAYCCLVARRTGIETVYPGLNQVGCVAGWAAPAHLVSFEPDSFVVLPETHSGDILHMLAWAVLLRVMQVARQAKIAPGETVGVLGSGFLARQIASFLHEHTWAGQVYNNQTTDQPPSQLVDVLLDTVGDHNLLAGALASVRPRGRVLFLSLHDLPSGSFNFYPEVHRHSLTLLAARGIFQPEDPGQPVPARRLFALLDHYSKTPWFVECEEALRNLPKTRLAEIGHQSAGTWIVN